MHVLHIFPIFTLKWPGLPLNLLMLLCLSLILLWCILPLYSLYLLYFFLSVSFQITCPCPLFFTWLENVYFAQQTILHLQLHFTFISFNAYIEYICSSCNHIVVTRFGSNMCQKCKKKYGQWEVFRSLCSANESIKCLFKFIFTRSL